MVRGQCKLFWCKEPHWASGYCVRHHRQFHRTGNPLAGDDANSLLKRVYEMNSALKTLLLFAYEDGICYMCGVRKNMETGKTEHYSGCEIGIAEALILPPLDEDEIIEEESVV